jgi:hypothetical protein
VIENDRLAQAQTGVSTGIFSQPQVFQPTQQDQLDAQAVARNTPPLIDRNAVYSLPKDINDVGGGKGNGYSGADDVARAVSVSLYDHTRRSGNEAGAWIVSKEVDGQNRFFAVAASRGRNNELDFVQAKADLDAYRQQNPNEKITVVSHIHSHPNLSRDQNGKLNVIGEGVSANDYDIWRQLTVDKDPKYHIQGKGYVVSGDGDVFRLDVPDVSNMRRSEQVGSQFGIFSAQSAPTLTRIGDVALGVDNPLKPNVWGAVRDNTDPDFGKTAAWLPQSRINDITLLSDQNHPDRKMYNDALQGIAKLDPNNVPFANEQQRQNAAAALVYEAKRNGLSHIDHVVASKDGQSLFAVQGVLGDPAATMTRPGLDKNQAAAQTVEASSLRLLNDSPNFVKPAQTTSQTETLANPTQSAGFSR